MRWGEELERGGGDDAERAFAADKELADVVAGGVFVQRGEVGEQAAVGQHHFQPEHQIARGAVAHHVQPAGVAGDVAADLAGAFAGEAERKQPPGLGSGFLHVLQNRAGFHGDGAVGQAEAADAVEPREVEQNAAVWHRRAAQAGVAALRGNRHAVFRAPAHQLLHVFHAVGHHSGCRPANVATAPVGEQRGGVGNDFAFAEQGVQGLRNMSGVHLGLPERLEWTVL